jgi:hypothetical protein
LNSSFAQFLTIMRYLQHNMKFAPRFIIVFVLLAFSFNAAAQDTIPALDTMPKFKVYKKNDGSIWVGWYNDYGVVTQITVQRSTDSLRRYASLFSSPNPMAKKGEFNDGKPLKGYDSYYRIFIQLPEGQYLYTTPQKAIPLPPGTLAAVELPPANQPLIKNGKNKPKPGVTEPGGTTPGTVTGAAPPPPKPPVFMPSDYIFNDKKGNIIINLPGAESKKYSIVFKDESGREVLKINHVKESNLVMEKSNFYKSGWYYFEIYEGETLFEKHKVLLPREKEKP